MSVPAMPPGSRSRDSWRSRCATPRASSSRPRNTTSSQRLTPMPGVSQRRRFTQRSQLAVEHRHGAGVLLAEPRRELLGEDDAAVVAAGAADGDREPGLALGDVGRDRELEELLQQVQEPLRDRLVEHVGADLVGQARSAAAGPGRRYGFAMNRTSKTRSDSSGIPNL